VRKNYLQKRVTAGKFTLPVAIIISIVCWTMTSILLPDLPKPEAEYSLLSYLKVNHLSENIALALSLFIFAFIGYSLIILNNTFGIIRMRASVQTSFYFLFTAVIPGLHQFHAGDIAALATLISIYFLFKSYQNHYSSAQLFHSFAFLGIGSLAFPQLTFFIPVWFISAYNFQSLNIRSFFAAIIGWSLPFWFLLGHAYYHNEMSLFYKPFHDMITFQSVNYKEVPLTNVIVTGFMFLLYVVSSINSFVTSYQDKIRTRSYLRFFILLNFFIFIFILLQPSHFLCLLSLLLTGSSILAGHLFALTNNRLSNLFFIFTSIAMVALYILNTWMLL